MLGAEMDENELILEGLPVEFDLVRSKLELYFKNRRKSGGEVQQIREHPEDKQKAILVYTNPNDLRTILEKGTHQIDFKPQGLIDLTVKLPPEVIKKKVKPLILPRPKLTQLKSVQSAQATGVQELGSTTKDVPVPHVDGNKDHANEENEETIRALLVSTMEEIDKETLTMYFEQFTEEAEMIKHGKNSWILKVANQSDIAKILAQEDHEFGVCVEIYKEDSGSRNWDPRRFILTGFKDACSHRVITVFIGSCSQKAEHTWEIVDDERIVVTFKDDIDVKTFLNKCAAKSKNLKDMEIGVSRLELTDSVLVQADMSQIGEDLLIIYFSDKNKSGGGTIASLNWVTKQKSLVISFQDSQDAEEVIKREHELCNTQLTALPFYSSLGKPLTGRRPTLSDISTKISLHVDDEICSFIERNEKLKSDFQHHLKKVHADVIYDISSPSEMILEMSLDKDSLVATRLRPTWENKAKAEAQSFLSKYHRAELPVKAEVWRRIQSDCLKLVSLGAEILYVESQCKIKIVGPREVIDPIADKIKNILKDAAAELEAEKNSAVKVIQFNSKQKLELVDTCVRSKLNNVLFTKDETALTFHLKGLKDDISAAERIIKQAEGDIAFQSLNLSAHLLNFLNSLDLKKFEQNHFFASHVPAYFLNANEQYGILADRSDVAKAEDIVAKILKEEVVHLAPDVTSLNNSQNWINFLSALKAEVDLSCNAQDVHIIQPDAQTIVICGFAQLVTYLSQKVRDYLANKTPETRDVRLKSLQEVQFVESCMNLSEVQEVRDLGVTVLPCKSLNSPCLKVTAAKEKIETAVTAVEQLLSAITVEEHMYSKAGASKVIQKHEADIDAKTKDWGCKAFISKEKTIKQYTHQITSQVSLTVVQDDLRSFAVNALVCPMDSQMTFSNPTAQNILQAGGPKIQSLSSVFKKEKQTLLSGEVVCSDSGNLNAKTLIYAGLPRSDHFLGSHYLTLAVFNSLQEANTGANASIAMPAMGCEMFGFSVKESCTAIRDAVLKFSSDRTAAKNIKEIFVVDPDLNVVETFNNILAELQTSNSSKVTTTQESQEGLNPKPSSSTEVIVHGVLVTLKHGDITKETTAVIVNSTNRSLDLDTGVSGAILTAAGKQVVDECKKHGPQKKDGVVFTSGGSLSCEHIAHVVGPDCAADIKVSIEKVLNLSEATKAASVAIPAIGTGRGAIGAHQSIKAIFSGVEKHFGNLKSSGIKEITVVAFEQTAFDEFGNFFKSFPEVSRAAPVTSSAKEVKIAGVRIQIKKGNLTNEAVRGIVNTTNDQMNLTGGVSGAIFKAAGPSVAAECRKHGPLQSDTVAVTRAGNLQCDFIIHMMGPHTPAEARLRVKKVLEQCEEKQISTISFPAIGTGRGGLQGVQSIHAMLQGVKDHLKQRSCTAVKLMYVVISQDDLLKDALQGLQQWTLNSQEDQDTDSDEEQSETEEWYNGSDDEIFVEEEEEEDDDHDGADDDDCSANSTDVFIGPVKVTVLCGDITKETTEAIVNSTNISLNLSSGVSGAILKAAGQTVVMQCKKLGVQPSDGVVLTEAGKLPTKNIVHMVGQTSEKEITRLMYKVLQECEGNKIRSVSFPALGTGAGNLAASRVANAMLGAVEQFSSDSPKFLKSVHVVVFQSNMLSDFSDALQNSKRVSTKQPVTVQTFNPNIEPTTSLAPEAAAATFPITKVAIYGTSSADVARVKKFLDDLVSEECTSEEVVSGHLANLSGTEKIQIMALGASNQVHVQVASEDKLTVSGKREDVLDVVRRIEKIVRDARDREVQEGEERRLGQILCWQIAEGDEWRSLGPGVSYLLELAFHKNEPSFAYQDRGETCSVNFKEMKWVNSRGRSSTVKRTLFGDPDTAIIQLPATWTKMTGKDLEIVTLLPDSDEYKKIKREFERSSKDPSVYPVQVVQIQRIQSQSQWQKYSVHKRAVDRKYPKLKNERILYHGTAQAICEKINRNGFNRSFCGRNAVVHGDGTYFARDASYSCMDQYSNPDRDGLKYVYRARVVTGLPCRSRRGMKEPDPLDPNDPRAGLYDCAVDDPVNPSIFVVFCDAGAYPDYLITFRNASLRLV